MDLACILRYSRIKIYDTWTWHAFFGTPRSNNDINVLWSSPMFDDVVNGWALEFQYKRQKSYRKDVERTFGTRWAIVRGPAQFWQTKDLHSIIMTCIILHNMIVEDEYSKIEEDSDEDVDDDQPTHARAIVRDVEYLAPTTYETQQDRVTLSEYMRPLNRIQAPQGHDTLCKDLVEHVWHREGEH
ncbi:hypothetical protein ACFX1W_013351 [Malus domestica]